MGREGAKEKETSATHPRTSIADIEVVPPLLDGELGPGLRGDPVAERADLALELAALVGWVHPVYDSPGGRLCMPPSVNTMSDFPASRWVACGRVSTALTILVCVTAVLVCRNGDDDEDADEGLSRRRSHRIEETLCSLYAESLKKRCC